MQRLLEASDFQLSELKTRPEGLSLYLCLPQRYMNTHYRWLRMMISLTVTEMEKVRGRPATGHPILMVLDEFAGLKRMEVIETAAAQIAGYGVKLFFVLQSLEQLKAVYKDNWETFLANSGLKMFFNLEDNFSRDYVSKLIGETEVIREVRSESDSTSTNRRASRARLRRRPRRIRGHEQFEHRPARPGAPTGRGPRARPTPTGGHGRPRRCCGCPASARRICRRTTAGAGPTPSSTGGSKGWNEGRSDGVSHGTSRSQTEGTSETTRHVGIPHGGSSETIQKRALVTPDEIGQLFARVDDRAVPAYPGLALVVISGAPPVALRRVNYYEDFQFVGLFDPNPDYPQSAAPKELTRRREVAGAVGMVFREQAAEARAVGDRAGPDGHGGRCRRADSSRRSGAAGRQRAGAARRDDLGGDEPGGARRAAVFHPVLRGRCGAARSLRGGGRVPREFQEHHGGEARSAEEQRPRFRPFWRWPSCWWRVSAASWSAPGP